jgi:hypothetical protein
MALPCKPLTVTCCLLGADGQACRIPHTPGAYPSDYLKACAFSSKLSLETVWVVQANGRTQAVSVAPWNPMPQPQLAPHAVVFTGWPTQTLNSNISASTLMALNEATATWLSQRTDGLSSWLKTQANTTALSEFQPIQLIVRTRLRTHRHFARHGFSPIPVVATGALWVWCKLPQPACGPPALLAPAFTALGPTAI